MPGDDVYATLACVEHRIVAFWHGEYGWGAVQIPAGTALELFTKDNEPQAFHLNMFAVPDDLREFLLFPQSGTQQVARGFFAHTLPILAREAFAAATSILDPLISV